MTEACKNHYDQLYTATGVVLAASFAGPNASEMAKSHAFISDYALWIDALDKRSEQPVFQSALREYQFALLALCSGHYRAAFAALRLTLELTFAGVQWSANERELREWKLGQRDSNWATLTDRENGILSKQFVTLFSEGLADEATQYLAPAVSVYRECSEYVHGNAHTQRSIPGNLAFDDNLFNAWHEKASVVRLAASFAFAARYLTDIDNTARSRLESMILDHLRSFGRSKSPSWRNNRGTECLSFFTALKISSQRRYWHTSLRPSGTARSSTR